MLRTCSACILALVAALPCATQAQTRPRLVLVEDAPEGRARGWLRQLDADASSLLEWADAREPSGTVEPVALEVLARVEAHLVAARRAAAALEEREALRELARAEALAHRHLTTPGMAAWYAEVQMVLAITAAQAELTSLADAALRRATTIDPSRSIQLGEAPPDLVERARAIARASSARGRFEVRADVPDAVAFLDDRPLGALPRSVEASVGRHVLRVEAPGHRSWAALIDVLEGERRAVIVRLAPTRARVEAQAVDEAARRGEVDRVERGLRALAELSPPPVWILWIGRGPERRAVLVRCGAERACGPATRLSAEGEAHESDLASALAWRDAIPAPVVEPPIHERWYVWVAAALALAAGAATAIGVAAQPRGPGPLTIEIDPTRLPRR